MFENDVKLREAGFKIHSREENKPAFWERGYGENKRIYEEKNALTVMEQENSKKEIKAEVIKEDKKPEKGKPKRRKPFGY